MSEPRARVLAETRLARPFLCPELELHLITPECPLWRATEADLLARGLADPFWGFAWGGGQVLARYLLDRPEVVRGRRVLALGVGSGLEAIASLLAGAREVIANDVDPIALVATRANAERNGVDLARLHLDPADRIGGPPPDVDVVLAGDVAYEPAASRRLVEWLSGLAAGGTLALVGDPGRGFLDLARLRPVFAAEVPEDVDGEGRHLRPARVYEVLSGG